MAYEGVELELGVLAFDGNVVEAFGWGADGGSRRFPVTKIKSIEVRPTSLTFECHGNFRNVVVQLGGEEAESGDLNGLLESIRGKAPDMECD